MDKRRIQVVKTRPLKDESMDRREAFKLFTCPFCEGTPEEPHEIKTRFSTMSGGKCPDCGAVYVYDETGRMLGEAFIDALALLFGEERDPATVSEDEYEEQILSYDAQRRRYMLGESPMMRAAKFLFLRRTDTPLP